jgi:hypothetical protein
MAARKHERFDVVRKANWDFFTAGCGAKRGYVANISKGGCLMKTDELIEHRRWIRVIVKEGVIGPSSNLLITAVGRVIRCEHTIEVMADREITLYRYGVEFVHASPQASQDFALILALSNKNLSVRSCLNLNIMSS